MWPFPSCCSTMLLMQSWNFYWDVGTVLFGPSIARPMSQTNLHPLKRIAKLEHFSYSNSKKTNIETLRRKSFRTFASSPVSGRWLSTFFHKVYIVGGRLHSYLRLITTAGLFLPALNSTRTLEMLSHSHHSTPSCKGHTVLLLSCLQSWKGPPPLHRTHRACLTYSEEGGRQVLLTP